MAYQSPPPPPSNSTYGDSELSDDGWSQHSGPPKFTNYPQGNMGGQAIQPAFNQGVGSRYAPGNIQKLGQNQAPAAQMPDLATLSSSMTQDDILFMRKVRSDCFFFRVLPLAAAGWGSLYMYNKSKQLPHSIGRYVLVGFSSLFIGITTYRGKFQQMIFESRSNTPYMQALRKSVGAQPLIGGDDYAGDHSIEYGSKVSDGSTNWDATELSGDLRFSDSSSSRSPGQLYPDSSYQAFEPSNLNTENKPVTSYDELRSKNRGYTR